MVEVSARTRFKIRAVALGDMAALIDLSAQLGYAVAVEVVDTNLRRMIGNRDHCLIAAVDERDIPVGWIHGFVRPLVESPLMVELGGLVVDRAWRGAGVGRALLVAIEAWAQQERIGLLTVRSGNDRSEAHRFYLGLGYELVKGQQVFRKRLQ